MEKVRGIIFAVMAAWAAWSVPVVSNVRLAQRNDYRTVDVWYDLSGERGIITLGVETNGVALPDATVTRLTGDVSVVVEPGSDRHVVWQANKDWPEQMVTNARAKVTAWATNAPPPYMVVDLSGGPAAAAYPVTYYPSAAALPDGGLANAAYRTTRMVMRLITGGVFYMGSPGYEPYRGVREYLHRVTLTNDYYIGLYPVTQRQWFQVAGANPSRWSNPDDWETRPVEYVSYLQVRECDTAVNTENAGLDWPSTGDAVGDGSFADRLRKRTGLAGFDLPSDAQWEYACRAGTIRGLNISGGINLTNSNEDANMNLAGRYKFNGGWLKDGANYIDIYSWSDAQKALVGATNATAKVGSYLPNAWGLYDMHGNVYEWVLDHLTDNLGYLPVTEPVGGSTGNRVLRGGSFYHQPGGSRSADRGTTGQTGRTAHIGFRMKCKVP